MSSSPSPPAPVRVLVVDDSAVMRASLLAMLSQERDLQVVGVATEGAKALDQVNDLKPDVVVLDVEMPGMGGLEFITALRRRHSRKPAVLVFSSFTESGAKVTIEALSAGADDYLTKPSQVGPARSSVEEAKAALLAKVRALALRSPGDGFVVGSPTAPRLASSPPARPESLGTGGDPPGPFDVLLIGASTGGPAAVTELVSQLPADFRLPVLIVLHMPPLFTRLFAEALSRHGSLPSREASAGIRPEPGSVYVAPGGQHLEVVDHFGPMLATTSSPPINSCRPSVDRLFQTAVRSYGSRTLACVLTGMGSDGVAGAREIRGAGGRVLVQDEPTSVVWGMPGAVARQGLAHQVLPISAMTTEVVAASLAARTGHAPT